jgi:hypothetical protein
MLRMIGLIAAPLLLAEQPWPVDPEQIRTRHGSAALFRFDLGVANPKDPCPAGAEPSAWQGSSREAAMEQALEQGNFYGAGEHLGAWLQQQRCP